MLKTRVLGRRLPNGKPQERLRFRDLRSKTLAFKKTHCDLFFCDLKTSLGARACFQSFAFKKRGVFAFAFLSPLSQEGCTYAGQVDFGTGTGRKAFFELDPSPRYTCFYSEKSQSAPKERRRRRAEKRLSKRVILESPFFSPPLKVCS